MSHKLPSAPIIHPDTVDFWDAASKGQFLMRWCLECDKTHWYPRTICPFCFSSETQWRKGSGLGVIYSYSILRRVETPFCIAYVTLDEGVSMMTNIVDCNLEQIRIGQQVKLVFKPSDGGPPLPMFSPVNN